MDIRFLTTALTIGGVGVLVPLIFIWVAASSPKKENEFRSHLFFPVLGIFVTAIMPFCCLMEWIKSGGNFTESQTKVDIIMCSLWIPFCSFCTLLLFFYKVTLAEKEFHYRNWIGITRRFLYSDITQIVAKYNYGFNLEAYYIYFGKKRVEVSYILPGFDHFLLLLTKQARNNGYKLPKIEKKYPTKKMRALAKERGEQKKQEKKNRKNKK